MKASKRGSSKRFETETPQLSDAAIARIRAAAHRYVMAGGSIFQSSTLTDLTEHIGNVGEELQGHACNLFEQALEATDFNNVEDQPRLSNLAGNWVSEEQDAAFLFGCFVGLEFAALTLGERTAVLNPKRSARRKRGAR